MMVIMQEGATDEQIAHVVARIEEVGASAHVSEGERVAVIGAIGDREELAGLPLEACPGVDRVVAILKPYKLVGREFHPHDTVVDVRGAKIGGGHFAHHRRALLGRDRGAGHGGGARRRGGRRHHAARRRVQAAHVALRLPGPRASTASSSWPRRATRPACRSSPRCMDPRDLDDLLAYADVLQIGARNMQNFQLLSEVGRADKPVLLKRGLSATIEEWLMAAEYIVKEGNREVILCERGIRTFETATRNTLDLERRAGRAAAQPPAGDRRPEPRDRAARPRAAAVAGRRRRRRRRRDGGDAPEPRARALRRAAVAVAGGLRRVRRARARAGALDRQDRLLEAP